MYYTNALLRWLQRKRYQYEVTFSLYMLTPTEKFIFSKPFLPPSIVSTKLTLFPDSVLFLVLSMIIIAASLYLPEHIATIANRAWFYYAGDEGSGSIPAVPKAMGDVGTGGAGAGEMGEGLR